MKANPRTTLHLLVVFSLLLASLFVAVTPTGASPEQQAVAAAPYEADSILVKFKPGTPAAEKANARAAVHGQVEREYTLVPGLEHLRLPVDKIGVEKAIEILSHRPSVEYAEPNYIVQAIETYPTDTYWSSLWGMVDIKAPTAWDTFKGSSSFVIADIDTGVAYTHSDIYANAWTNPNEIAGNGKDDDGNGCVDDIYGCDFVNNDGNPLDDNGHGTHTAGTMGAVGNNGVGVVGVNWNVKIMALKFLNKQGSGTDAGAIAALEYAVLEGAKVSNNSWGGGGYNQAMFDAIAAAGAQGHLFVAAAGNGDLFGRPINNDTTPFYPASYSLDNIIAVAALDTSGDKLASFSNYGAASVDLAAPGVNILSTVLKNSYGYKSGTSMATPHVAGAAALLWGRNPNLTYSQVKDLILNNVETVSALSGKTATGGKLDLAKAMAAMTPQPPPPAAPTGLTATAVSTSEIDLAWADNSNNETGFELERCQGTSCTTLPLGANVTSHADTGLAEGTTYSYRVRACNAYGCSAYSNTARATTQGTAPPADTVHVGALTASTSTQGAAKWKATVTITAHKGDHSLLSGATVTGQWSAGATGTASCTTGTSGTCSVSKANLTGGSVTFTVASVAAPGYEPGTNDVEAITIDRPVVSKKN